MPACVCLMSSKAVLSAIHTQDSMLADESCKIWSMLQRLQQACMTLTYAMHLLFVYKLDLLLEMPSLHAP